MEDTKGEFHAMLGVARLTHQPLWACHLSQGAWHANSSLQGEPSLWRATCYRRRGTPTSKSHLGVPLEQPGVARQCTKWPKQGLGVPLDVEGVARQPKNLTMACHLSIGRGMPATGTKARLWAWHASL
ncbi:uncharacterized protein DS421_11g338110 [Arachis hypogaea]|nr:uncharacterized protein DS421_11g338110 [Arachis hypogaea]